MRLQKQVVAAIELFTIRLACSGRTGETVRLDYDVMAAGRRSRSLLVLIVMKVYTVLITLKVELVLAVSCPGKVAASRAIHTLKLGLVIPILRNIQMPLQKRVTIIGRVTAVTTGSHIGMVTILVMMTVLAPRQIFPMGVN